MKIDIQNFNQNTMLAKLLNLTRTYERKQDELLADRATFENFVKDAVKENFIYPEKIEATVIAHLSLFLLGNQENQFSKFVYQY